MVLVFALVASLVGAEEQIGVIYGNIKLADGTPPRDAQIHLYGEGFSGHSVWIENCGGFRFVYLPGGTYNIKVTAGGFKTLILKDVVLKPGSNPRVSLTLEKK